MVNFMTIPAELKTSCRFTVWKKEKGKDGRLTKVPYNPATGQRAQSNNPATFSDFGKAAAAYAIGGYEGIGIRVSDGIAAFDIDHCIRDDGTLNDVAASVLDIFKTAYVEKSPSGSGLRGFFHIDPDYIYDTRTYYINNRKFGLEIYIPGATNRFVTVTGDVYRTGDIPLDMMALQTVLDKFMKRKSKTVHNHIEPQSYLSDEEVIQRVSQSAQAEKFEKLYKGGWENSYGSQSDADMALLCILAFWCGCDKEQMDRIFRSSGLMRDKWDRRQSGSTYGELSIEKAVANCIAIFDPVKYLVPPEDEFEKILEDNVPSGGSGITGITDTTDTPDDPDIADDTEEELPPDAKRDLAISISLINQKLSDMHPHANPLYSWSEMGLGRLFADYYERVARYVPERKSWYVYNGTIWKQDVGEMLVMQLAKHLVNNLIRYAATIDRDSERADYLEFITKIQTRRKRQIMVDDAQDEHFLIMQAFDQNKYLFNCVNGTLNLKTMEFHEHRPEDFLTMKSGVRYDPNATCARWESFISEVMCGDSKLADFLQRSLGYALTGDTSLECLFILYGATSRNGKGTCMETYLKIMGDYGKTSNPEMLGAKYGNNNSGGPSEEIARLVGTRFVNISEPEKKITFNAALVKRLTGNDSINARFLHENSFDFKPVFKIFINTNYLPNVTDMTLFDSGRLKIIPFKRHFAEDEQDKTLKHFFSLEENLSGILNWCLEGYRKFCKNKLDLPQAVIDATAQYRKQSDRISQFIEAWIEEGEAYEVRTSAVYKVYERWCNENGFRSESSTELNKGLALHFTLKRGRPKGEKNPTTLLIGCRLREDEEALVPIE